MSANFFQVLNARPLHGRTFLPEEDTPGRERVAVLGYGLWERRFGADPGIVGQIVRLEGQPHDDSGGDAEGIRLSGFGGTLDAAGIHSQERNERTARSIDVIARLRPGIR